MKLETKFQNRVLKDLKSLPHTWVLKTQERARRGVPDILLCFQGHFVAIELKKSEKEDPKPLQEFELNCIKSAMGVALVAYPENWSEILKKLALLSQGMVER